LVDVLGRLVPFVTYLRAMRLSPMVGVVLCSWCLALCSPSSGAADGSGASRLFAPGANLCKLVSTTKLAAATGLKLPTPVSGRHFCTWQVSPGVWRDSVQLFVRSGLGRKGVESTTGGRGVKVTTVTVPGASYARLLTAGYRGMIRDSVAAVYPNGTVFVTVTAPGLTSARAIAAATVVVSQ
jgi:hypothetical protein